MNQGLSTVFKGLVVVGALALAYGAWQALTPHAAASAGAPGTALAAQPGGGVASDAAPLAGAGRGAESPLAASAAGSARPPLFVLNSLDATISQIDLDHYTEIRRVPTGKEPHHLYLSPDEDTLLVANALGNSITLLDTRTGAVRKVLEDIVDPYQLRFSPDMKWFVTAANRLDHIDVYRVTRQPGEGFSLALAKRVPAGKTPSHVFIDTESTVVYASLQDSDQITSIDLATQTSRWTVPCGKMPADIFLTPDNRTLLVALTGDRVVEAYDVTVNPPKLVKRIPTGEGAHSFRAWGDRRHVLVSNRVENSISLIDMQTLETRDKFPAPSGPDDMELSPDRRFIYVASRWAGKLSVIDTKEHRVVQQVPVGKSPHGVWSLEHAPRL